MATSVPLIPIDIPISALLSAGASFTPSPVMATISPFLFKEFTILNLWLGDTLANTEVFSTILSNSSSVMLSNSVPVIAFVFSSYIPSSFAIAFAVITWSPVIIIVLIPASLQVFMEFGTSSLGGSIIPTMPMKVRFVSIFSPSFGTLSRIFLAKPKTLKASEDREVFKLSIFSLYSAVKGCIPLVVRTLSHTFKSSSKAPFTYAVILPSIL